jgi:peroxiredoxin family protein
MRLMGLPTGNLGIPNLLGIIPGMTAFTSWFMRKKMAAIGAPPVDEYVQMLVDGGAKLYACKMSVDMFGLKKEDFVDGVIDIVTASDFMDFTEGSQIIFI